MWSESLQEQTREFFRVIKFAQFYPNYALEFVSDVSELGWRGAWPKRRRTRRVRRGFGQNAHAADVRGRWNGIECTILVNKR